MFPHENISEQAGVFNRWMLLIKVDIYVVLLVFFCIRKWLFTWVDQLISDLRICSP